MEDFMQHLTNTNSTKGGPSLKIEVKLTTDIKDKTTTTTKIAGVTVVGTESVSRIDGTTTQGVTVSGPIALGDIPNATLGIGVSTNNKGFTTISTTLSSSGTVGNSTFTAGVEAAISGNNGGRANTSFIFSGFSQVATDSNIDRRTTRVKF